jgi:hypothetical protein
MGGASYVETGAFVVAGAENASCAGESLDSSDEP